MHFNKLKGKREKENQNKNVQFCIQFTFEGERNSEHSVQCTLSVMHTCKHHIIASHTFGYALHSEQTSINIG